MKNYEVLYIVKPIDEKVVDSNVSKFKSLINENSGCVEKIDVWGKKRLAYEMQGFNEGIYILMKFKAEFEAIKELDRVMKLNDLLLRHMIIKLGE